ncbi:hypothetical protein FHS86_002367 [Roseimarinus sediminis]
MAVLVQISTIIPAPNIVGMRTENHTQSATPLTIFRYKPYKPQHLTHYYTLQISLIIKFSFVSDNYSTIL